MAYQDLLYMLLAYPIAYILPAWVANGTPVIFGAGKPIDGGRKFRGRPIFGKNKTRRGLVTGIIGGAIIGLVESSFLGAYMLPLGVVLAVGTLLGDLLGSFIKRRLGQEEGRNFAIPDAYLFLVVALAMAFPLGHRPTVWGLLVIVVLTGILHRATNIMAHKTRIKKVPW